MSVWFQLLKAVMVLTGSSVVFPWFRELVQWERCCEVFDCPALSRSLSLLCAFTLSVTLCIQAALSLWQRAHSTHRPLSIPAFLCDTDLLDTPLTEPGVWWRLWCCQKPRLNIIYDMIRLIPLPPRARGHPQFCIRMTSGHIKVAEPPLVHHHPISTAGWWGIFCYILVEL